MKKAAVLMMVLFISSCIAGPKKTFIQFQKVVHDTAYYFVPDTERICENKMVVRKVVEDTVTIKIDTSYSHSLSEKSCVATFDSSVIFRPLRRFW